MAAQGGMSMSNNFDVQFEFTNSNEGLKQRFKDLGMDFSSNNGTAPDDDKQMGTSAPSLLKMLCEEAQLPNVQAATGTYTGMRMGEGQVNYAHSKMYTDFQLGWMCDANMTPLKFLNAWYSYIFGEYRMGGNVDTLPVEVYGNNSGLAKTGQSLTGLKTSSNSDDRNAVNKFVRLRYPDEYQCRILISKSEKGQSAPNGRPSMLYTMMECFPYAIDAVPLSYGASQITKVTANFYYSKYSIVYNDIRKMKG